MAVQLFRNRIKRNIKTLYIVEVRDSPHGIFHPCTLWARGLARCKNCRRIAAVAVGVIFLSARFSKENYTKLWFCEEFKEQQ